MLHRGLTYSNGSIPMVGNIYLEDPLHTRWHCLLLYNQRIVVLLLPAELAADGDELRLLILTVVGCGRPYRPC